MPGGKGKARSSPFISERFSSREEHVDLRGRTRSEEKGSEATLGESSAF